MPERPAAISTRRSSRAPTRWPRTTTTRAACGRRPPGWWGPMLAILADARRTLPAPHVRLVVEQIGERIERLLRLLPLLLDARLRANDRLAGIRCTRCGDRAGD